MRARRILVAAIALLSTIAIGGETASASASRWTYVERFGCTLAVHTPVRAYSSAHRRYWAYSGLWVKCDTNRTVIVNAQLREADLGSSQKMSLVEPFAVSILTRNWHHAGWVTAWCQNLDWGHQEEVYTRAWFNVGGLNSAKVNTKQLSVDC